MAVTAQTIVTRARYRTDKLNSVFVHDTNDLLPWADKGYKELYDTLVTAYGSEWFMTTTDLRVAASSRTTAFGTSYTTCSGIAVDSGLPLYKLVRLDIAFDSIRVPLRQMSFSDRVLDDRARTWDESVDIRYRLTQATFFWDPIPDANMCVRVYYVPFPTGFTALTSVMDPVTEQWADFVELHVAMCIRQKEQDTEGFRALALEKEAVRQRLINQAPPRDIGQPSTIVDVRSNDEDAGDAERWAW